MPYFCHFIKILLLLVYIYIPKFFIHNQSQNALRICRNPLWFALIMHRALHAPSSSAFIGSINGKTCQLYRIRSILEASLPILQYSELVVSNGNPFLTISTHPIKCQSRYFSTNVSSRFGPVKYHPLTEKIGKMGQECVV